MEQNVCNKGPASEGEVTQSLRPTSTRRIWKNLIVLAVVFLVNFTAFRALQNLQSTLNSEAGLGVVSLSCVYASMVLSCLYAPFFIHKVGSCKWTVVVCFFGHILYTGSNFYPSWFTLIPSSILLGAISGPLWTAQITYLTSSAQEYAKLVQHDNTEGDIAKFNGVFYFIFELAGLSGNLISSLVLSVGKQDIGKGEFCGAMDCGVRPEAKNWTYYVTNSSTPPMISNNNSTTEITDEKQQVIVYTLFGVFLACNILAALIAGLCLDKDVKNLQLASSEPVRVSQLLLRTVRVFKDIDYVLLMPLLVIIGMSEAIVAGEVTKSYVSCVLGVQMVGYVMVSFSVTSGVFSPLFGHLSKYTGTRILTIAAVVANAVLLIYMLLWQPDEDSLARILSVAGGWGVVRAVWHTQLYAVLGATFPTNQEAVFANTKMTQSVGNMLVFAYSAALCMDVKLYIYIAVLAVGTVGYGALEWKTRDKNSPRADTLGSTVDRGKGCDAALERWDLMERETSI
ncbi:protein unc-93 homolog A-like [Branchiostoma floridae]|uniref:Protein unc-93 homolog A n=1 Tax=Branchiostoma floridae TaxID=7739 RepID=A0A9J7MUH2_BRAFL|nr:protein unc-93 homolog A-like [Branchiostoma floridae]